MTANPKPQQLDFSALFELRQVEVALAEEAIGAIQRAGVELDPEYLATIEIAEDSRSWIGDLVFELLEMRKRAERDLPRLKSLLGRILHENVDSWLAEREAEVQHEEASPPRRIEQSKAPAVPKPRSPLPRTPRTPKLEETLTPTKKLTSRQQELLGVIKVSADNIGRFDSKEHVPDWAELKKVMLSLGSKWKTKTGFAFPDDVDGAETVRIALESGEIIDWDGAGFFPTPDDEADRLVAMFRHLPENPHLLEPSAGTGSLIRACRRRWEHPSFYACELIEKNRQELARLHVDVVANDFLGMTVDDFCGENIMGIVANPPFAKRADIRHITHAIGFLQPGAELAAIASAGVKFRDDALARDFRALLARHDAVIEDADKGAFLASGTGVSTVRIWLQKKDL